MSATFRGYLENASQLPIRGGHEGDTYIIGRDTWVLTTPAGLNRLAWVDP